MTVLNQKAQRGGHEVGHMMEPGKPASGLHSAAGQEDSAFTRVMRIVLMRAAAAAAAAVRNSAMTVLCSLG